MRIEGSAVRGIVTLRVITWSDARRDHADYARSHERTPLGGMGCGRRPRPLTGGRARWDRAVRNLGRPAFRRRHPRTAAWGRRSPSAVHPLAGLAAAGAARRLWARARFDRSPDLVDRRGTL